MTTTVPARRDDGDCMTLALLVEGAQHAVANAIEHRADAECLARDGRHGRGMAALIFAVEEAEKAELLLGFAMDAFCAGAEVARRTVITALREAAGGHRTQAIGAVQAWGWPHTTLAADLKEALVAGGPHAAADAAAVFGHHPEVLAAGWSGEQIKQRALYVDLSVAGEWRVPASGSREEYGALRDQADDVLQVMVFRVGMLDVMTREARGADGGAADAASR